MHHRFHGIGHETGGIATGSQKCRDKQHSVKRKKKTPHKNSPYPIFSFGNGGLKAINRKPLKMAVIILFFITHAGIDVN
jgi:hypothetical protein